MERYASFVIVAAVLILWFWRHARARAAVAAARREALLRQQLVAEFGLSPDEVATQIWSAQSYIGALRPGAGEASMIDRVAHSLAMSNRRAAMFRVAVTSHGRVMMSREPAAREGRRFEPYGVATAGRGVLLSFADAFPGAKFPAKDAPAASRGRRWTLVVLGCDDQPRLALWIDQDAVQPLAAALARPRVARPRVA